MTHFKGKDGKKREYLDSHAALTYGHSTKWGYRTWLKCRTLCAEFLKLIIHLSKLMIHLWKSCCHNKEWTRDQLLLISHLERMTGDSVSAAFHCLDWSLHLKRCQTLSPIHRYFHLQEHHRHSHGHMHKYIRPYATLLPCLKYSNDCAISMQIPELLKENLHIGQQSYQNNDCDVIVIVQAGKNVLYQFI